MEKFREEEAILEICKEYLYARFVQTTYKVRKMGKGYMADVLGIVSKTKWYKPFFLIYTKCDVVDNNTIETFNGWIIRIRANPIISMLEEIEILVMPKMYTDK